MTEVWRSILSRGAAVLAVSLGAATAHAEFRVPSLTGSVVDQADIIEPRDRAMIEATLRAVKDRGGPQINVVTVKTLEGLPIESATIKITDSWKLGDKKRDDGLLLLVALDERRIRIEVGQGLEGVLTDVESKRIIDDQMTPFFRAGRASDGILVGVRAVLMKVAPDIVSSLGEAPRGVLRSKQKRETGLPLPFLILIILFFMFAGRRGRRSGLLGALAGAALGAGHGGRGGGFSGGSGWSGGGGGFSGGGASGGW